jgi:hypothetical protein
VRNAGEPYFELGPKLVVIFYLFFNKILFLIIFHFFKLFLFLCYCLSKVFIIKKGRGVEESCNFWFYLFILNLFWRGRKRSMLVEIKSASIVPASLNYNNHTHFPYPSPSL